MIYVRSHEEANEQVVCDTHTDVCKELNKMCAGRCLYTGAQRAQLERFKLMLEKMIAGELEVLPAHTVRAKHYAIHLLR